MGLLQYPGNREKKNFHGDVVTPFARRVIYQDETNESLWLLKANSVPLLKCVGVFNIVE